MDSETLLITVRSLRLFINFNEDLITGEKLLMYDEIDEMVATIQCARARRKKWFHKEILLLSNKLKDLDGINFLSSGME